MKQASLGQRLYALRKYRGLSLQDLANATGISRSNLNRYEHDASKPTAEFLKRLCTYYQVSSDYLLFGMKEADWDECDPELKGMVQQLAHLMNSGEPHQRSWAIMQFKRAFQAH